MYVYIVFFRILRQKQYEKEREREFLLALEREAVSLHDVQYT